MEEKHTALVVLGLIVILGIIGLVLMFNSAKTGATVGGGVYMYPKSPFPYTRQINKVTENPAAYGVQTEAQIPTYGGASRFFGGSQNPGAEEAVSQGFVYARDPEKKIHQVFTSCTGQVNIGAIPPGYTRGVSVQQAMSIGLDNCVKTPEQISNFAFCCKEPGQTRY
ncbi:hypothetical protein KY333_01815 [Candidatus Woesearchaeota archaeon]|nr:hypothetical protein [Candidatus Woesearchaeota archaeon]MBW2993852.1 hypothetical protein [Candidatus Woesearchaeota archaeon]